MVWAERSIQASLCRDAKLLSWDDESPPYNYIFYTQKQWHGDVCIFGTLTVLLRLDGLLFFSKPGKCLCSRENIKEYKTKSTKKTQTAEVSVCFQWQQG